MHHSDYQVTDRRGRHAGAIRFAAACAWLLLSGAPAMPEDAAAAHAAPAGAAASDAGPAAATPANAATTNPATTNATPTNATPTNATPTNAAPTNAAPADAAQTVQAASQAAQVELGRRLYTEGTLASGAAVSGARLGSKSMTGAAAACVNCHRRSGMGQVEADLQVPPITGTFLFAERGDKRITTMDPRVSKLFNQTHDPYTAASLAVAIRDGTNNQGKTMSLVMPRYALSDPDLKALTAYLRQLSAQWSPGVTPTEIHLATVITPDVDPERRKVFIDMMRAILRQKNGSTVTANQARTRHHMTSAAELMLGTERKWDLEIWELEGPPQTWGEQLAEHYRSHPVFALVSGLSNGSWQPVQDFCERNQVPCWFPSVDLPGESPSSYAFYFSAGVRLESAVLARYLASDKMAPKRIVQIYRDANAGADADAGADAGAGAARALRQALAGSGIEVSDRPLESGMAAADSLRQALGGIGQGVAVVFWLRPDDIEALDKIAPAPAMSYFSAVLAGGDQAPIPAAWRAQARLVYPYELPERRRKNLDTFHAWLNLSKVPLIDEPMQSEVFFSLSFLTDTISEMLDNLYRDYLVERAETMLSKREAVKSEQETRDRAALGSKDDLLRRHGLMTMEESARIPLTSQAETSAKSQGTTLYPHLSLGPGQRFASKGGYIVRFAAAEGQQVSADSDWIVP
jgi:cytochrome c